MNHCKQPQRSDPIMLMKVRSKHFRHGTHGDITLVHMHPRGDRKTWKLMFFLNSAKPSDGEWDPITSYMMDEHGYYGCGLGDVADSCGEMYAWLIKRGVVEETIEEEE